MQLTSPPPRTACATFLVLLASCATPVRIDGDVAERLAAVIDARDVPRIRVLRRVAEGIATHSGSGTRLERELAVTCAHVWPPDAYLAAVDGELAGLWQVQEHGDGVGSTGDWVVLKTPPADPLRYVVDLDWRPSIGATLIVCGYPTRERDAAFLEQSDKDLRIVAGEIVPMPDGLPDSDELIVFRTREDQLEGLSGGPALAWDPLRNAAVLFGMTSVTITVLEDGHLVDRVHAVRILSFLTADR